MMKKRIAALAAGLILGAAGALAGCGSGQDVKAAKLGWSTGLRGDNAYDTSLFYRNDNTFSSPDPGMIYIEEGEDAGYYYFYPTSIDGLSVRAYRTKDFVDYELINGAAFTFQKGGWAVEQIWAPEVIYYKTEGETKGKYIMYYSASAFPTDSVSPANKWNGMNIGIAVSESPKGPFVDYVGEQQYQPYGAAGVRIDPDDHDRVLSESEADIWKTRTVELGTPPLFYAGDTPEENYELGSAVYNSFAETANRNVFATIDAHPFVDDDGQMYMYFVKHQDVNTGGNSVWGVKMKDPYSPDYGTITKIAVPGKKTPDATEAFADENYLSYGSSINEGPAMVKHTTVKPDGTKATKYYLTYSNYGFDEKMYAVCLAVCDSPLGVFEKPDFRFGQPILSAEASYDHMSGVGHNKFFYSPTGELYTAYHAWCTPTLSDQRGVMVDRVFWVYNEELGFDMMHINGPSQSLQPLPESVSGYKNIAKDAEIAVTNTADSARLLTDDLIAIHSYSRALELRTDDSATITLDFSKNRRVRGIMVYNSYDLNYAFSQLDRVIVEDEEGNRYSAEDVLFPASYISKTKEGDATMMRPGGACTIVFREQNVKKITITISRKVKNAGSSGNKLGLSEIIVLGK